MTATTGQDRFNTVSRLSNLSSQAITLVLKDDGQARDEDMVSNLLRALQLFKDNQLGEIHFKIPAAMENSSKPLAPEVAALRKAFRSKIDKLGKKEVQRQLYTTLPTRPRRALWSGVEALHVLVQYNESRARRIKGLGKLMFPFVVAMLQKEGLNFGMTLLEVEECFGVIEPREVFDPTPDWE